MWQSKISLMPPSNRSYKNRNVLKRSAKPNQATAACRETAKAWQSEPRRAGEALPFPAASIASLSGANGLSPGAKAKDNTGILAERRGGEAANK